nr:hypothetical protein [Tanacetum cinerariifolium]
MQTQTSNALHNAIIEAGSKDRPPMLACDKYVPVFEGSTKTTTERYMENYKNVSQDIHDQLNAEAEAVHVTPPNWPAAEYWVRGVLLHGSTTQDIY